MTHLVNLNLLNRTRTRKCHGKLFATFMEQRKLVSPLEWMADGEWRLKGNLSHNPIRVSVWAKDYHDDRRGSGVAALIICGMKNGARTDG